MIKFYLISLLVFLSVSAQAKYCDELPIIKSSITNSSIYKYNSSVSFNELNSPKPDDSTLANVFKSIRKFVSIDSTPKHDISPNGDQVTFIMGYEESYMEKIYLKKIENQCFIEKIEITNGTTDKTKIKIYKTIHTELCHSLRQIMLAGLTDEQAVNQIDMALARYNMPQDKALAATKIANAKSRLADCNEIPEIAAALKDTSLWTAPTSSSTPASLGTRD